MDGGYPLQMDFSLSSSSKRFWDLWSGHGHWVFFFFSAVRVLHSQWLVWGEILRGELSGMERVEWRRFVCIFARECVREREGERCFSGPSGQCAKKKKNHSGARTHGAFFEKAACISFAQISPNPSHLNLSPPQSACQQINTIRKDNSAGPGLTVISQISERPREDTFPKPRLSPQIWSLRPS